jgi:hypothetical protein
MAGEIDVAIAGHVAKLMFFGDRIVLRFADYRSAVALMRIPTPDLKILGKLLAFSNIGLMAHVGNRKPREIFPNPSRITRWLSPKVRAIIGSN